MYSWGNSNSGQLGMGDTETNPQPRPLHLGVSSGTKITGITCGTRHSFIWTQDGDCFSFGNNYSGQLGYDFRKPDFKENQVWNLLFLYMYLIYRPFPLAYYYLKFALRPQLLYTTGTKAWFLIGVLIPPPPPPPPEGTQHQETRRL